MSKHPSLDAAKALHLVSSNGILSRTLKGFEPRKPQQEMMSNVIEAFNENAIALIEAGTGTGKSLAYLLPAILWALENHQRTLISTHTIALQEQLIHKDLPQLIKALNIDIKAVLVKGMSNYLCLRKLYEALQERLLLTPEERAELDKVEAWAETTKEGSKSSLPMMPTFATWEKVCAESDTCSHAKCPHYQACFFFKARSQAEEAQILVSNHHLLFADLSVRAESDNYKGQAILPAYSRLIIDEAHHIEDIATEFFGDHVSKIGILRLLSRIATEKQNTSSGKLAIIKEKLEQMNAKSLDATVSNILSRINLDLFSQKNNVQIKTKETFQIISDCVDRLASQQSPEEINSGENKLRLLSHHYAHDLWQQEVIPAGQGLILALHQYIQTLNNLEKDLEGIKNDPFQEQSKAPRQDLAAFVLRLEAQADLLDKLIIKVPEQSKVRWAEVRNSQMYSNVSLQDADLDISKALVDYLFNKVSSVVLCSATLTTNQRFNFVRQRLGLSSNLLPHKKITENVYDSPFNYTEQAMLIIPTDLPAPQYATFLPAAIEQIWQAIEASRGGAFVLFTSYSMMNTCHELLAERLQGHRYTVFKQGSTERQKLLESYKASSRAVLFGTDSFWEGIDVAGESLRCVIIVKLPFRVPSEPIIQARAEALLANGQDPFFEYTLPNAIVKFKQGFGRLIRHAKDRGCIICLDTRLIHKNYGHFFLNSLPKCQQSFTSSEKLAKEMGQFYKKTHHLTLRK